MTIEEAAAALRAGVDQCFADLRTKALAATTIGGATPQPDWDDGVPVPWCSANRCPFWDGSRCYQLQAAPELGVCDPVFAVMHPAQEPGEGTA